MVGAPNVAAVPVCVFGVVGKQLSAAATLELLDDVLVEELIEELVELVLVEELVELVLVEELAFEDSELLDELLPFAALAVGAALAALGSAEPPLHAANSEHRLAKKLTTIWRAVIFMVQLLKILFDCEKCST